MTEQSFTLRSMQMNDSTAVGEFIADAGGDMTTRFLIDPYTAIMEGNEARTMAVVAEQDGTSKLAGMGTIRFGECYFNGAKLPFAMLDGLKVKEEFRGQGLGRRLAQWRTQKALEEYGENCVILTGLLVDNHASRAVARKWCREFVEPIQARIMPMRSQPPKTIPGITVREVEPQEYEQFAAKHNHFYTHYNFWSELSPSKMDTLTRIAPGNQRIYRYFAALDDAGNLLAGAQVYFRGQIKYDQFNNPPLPLRLLNSRLQLFGSDFTIRDITLNGFWFAQGQSESVKYFYENLRFILRSQGSVVVIHYGPHDPLISLLQNKPWYMPKVEIAMAVRSQTPVDRSRLVYMLGRI